MAEGFPLIPIIPGGGGADVDVSPGWPRPGETFWDWLDRVRPTAPTTEPSTTPGAPPVPPSLDLPPIQPAPPTQSVQLPPIPTAEFASVIAAPGSRALWLLAGRSSKEAERLKRLEGEAYGLRMGRARRMARRKRTMRAQLPGTAIDPRSLPVPIDQVITADDVQRATDEEVRRRARERGAQRVPNAPPPDEPRRQPRGGRLTPIFDPFALAEDIGATIGEVAGEVVGEREYGQTEAELAAAAKREAELRRRRREQAVPLPGELEGTAAFPPGVRLPPKLDKAGDPIGGMRRIRLPAPPPPAPKRSRMQRAMHQIQRVTSNPWAQLGVFGLGLLGGRRRSRSTLPVVATFADEPVDVAEPVSPPLTGFNAGMLPFSGGVPITPRASTTSGCDCKPKRRGPKRRCLERGDVSWRTGRYKGKRAGTKCIRWE